MRRGASGNVPDGGAVILPARGGRSLPRHCNSNEPKSTFNTSSGSSTGIGTPTGEIDRNGLVGIERGPPSTPSLRSRVLYLERWTRARNMHPRHFLPALQPRKSLARADPVEGYVTATATRRHAKSGPRSTPRLPALTHSRTPDQLMENPPQHTGTYSREGARLGRVSRCKIGYILPPSGLASKPVRANDPAFRARPPGSTSSHTHSTATRPEPAHNRKASPQQGHSYVDGFPSLPQTKPSRAKHPNISQRQRMTANHPRAPGATKKKSHDGERNDTTEGTAKASCNPTPVMWPPHHYLYLPHATRARPPGSPAPSQTAEATTPRDPVTTLPRPPPPHLKVMEPHSTPCR